MWTIDIDTGLVTLGIHILYSIDGWGTLIIMILLWKCLKISFVIVTYAPKPLIYIYFKIFTVTIFLNLQYIYSLISVFQVVAAAAPRPVIVQMIRPCTARTSARRKLAVATCARDKTGRTSGRQRVHKRHFRGAYIIVIEFVLKRCAASMVMAVNLW